MNNNRRPPLSAIVTAVLSLSTLAFLWSYGCVRKTDETESYDPLAEFKEADVRVLFIGNSHTHVCGMTEMFRELCEADGQGRRFHVDTRTGSPFLAGHSENSDTLNAIAREGWDVVVLQAQKYSTTGKYSYPIRGAIKLTKIAQDKGARVIMFPEWRRRGHLNEARRVHALHQSIVEKTGAEVAPVGLAWDRVLFEDFSMGLHDYDGNHASMKGAYLTACVFYAVVTGKSPEGLPIMDGCEFTDEEAALIQTAAWETVSAPVAESPRENESTGTKNRDERT